MEKLTKPGTNTLRKLPLPIARSEAIAYVRPHTLESFISPFNVKAEKPRPASERAGPKVFLKPLVRALPLFGQLTLGNSSSDHFATHVRYWRHSEDTVYSMEPGEQLYLGSGGMGNRTNPHGASSLSLKGAVQQVLKSVGVFQ